MSYDREFCKDCWWQIMNKPSDYHLVIAKNKNMTTYHKEICCANSGMVLSYCVKIVDYSDLQILMIKRKLQQ